jgi:hypothetical protein
MPMTWVPITDRGLANGYLAASSSTSKDIALSEASPLKIKFGVEARGARLHQVGHHWVHAEVIDVQVTPQAPA